MTTKRAPPDFAGALPGAAVAPSADANRAPLAAGFSPHNLVVLHEAGEVDGLSRGIYRRVGAQPTAHSTFSPSAPAHLAEWCAVNPASSRTN